MKSKILFLFMLGLGLIFFSQSSAALTLAPQESLWVGIESPKKAPQDFSGMTLFFGWDSGSYLSYDVYRPFPESGGVETDYLSVDLSPFQDNYVFFKFTNGSTIGSEAVKFPDNALIWGDDNIPGGMTTGNVIYPFYFAFYDNVASQGWENRVVDIYIPGEILAVIPPNVSPFSHGDLFFQRDLSVLPQFLNFPIPLRADFGAVPEPSSIVLLASGLVGFIAVVRKKRNVGKPKGRITVIEI